MELLDPLIISNLNNPVIKFYYDKIIRREFPKLSQEFVDKEYFKEHVSQVGKNEIIMKFKIGLINKKENPLDLVPFYSVKDNKPKSVINTSIPQMMYGNKKISEEHLEFITRIYRD